MSAMERIECPECGGTGGIIEEDCSRCHGIGSVLVESNQLGPCERGELEAIIKEMSDECDKLRRKNEDLNDRLTLIKDKAERIKCENDILRARVEMVYLIFGGEPND